MAQGHYNGYRRKILSDPNHGFVNPSISPDGKWLICAGNNLSPMSKGQNMDLFIARADGSGLKQVTNHPANDVYPTWQKNGKHVYFFSLRGTEYNDKYGVNFSLFTMDVSSFLE